MDRNGSKTKAAVYLVAVALMALYFVFIVERMARSDGAERNLLVLALAIGAGVVAAAVGLVASRARRR